MSTIAIDFDHVICDTQKGINITSHPLKDARRMINILREQGHRILIHSCNNVKFIEKWMNDNDIRFDYIWDDVGKPVADCYIDDKALRFYSWKQIEDELPYFFGKKRE